MAKRARQADDQLGRFATCETPKRRWPSFNHCHVAIHNGTLTNRLKALIDEGTLTPTGEWALPAGDEPIAGDGKRTGRKRREVEIACWRAG
jgi:hypothetical protein